MDPRKRAALLGLTANPVAPPELLIRLSALPEAAVEIAESRDTFPLALAERLLATGEPAVTARLDHPERVPPQILQRIASHPDSRVRDAWRLDIEAMVQSRCSTVEAEDLRQYAPFEELAVHPDPAFRLAVSKVWTDMPASTRQALLADPDPDVRAAVTIPPPELPTERMGMYDPRLGWVDELPEQERLKHLESPLPQLRARAALTLDLTPALGARLDEDENLDVRLIAARRPDTPPAVLLRLFDAVEGAGQQFGLIRHPNFPIDEVVRLARSTRPNRWLATKKRHLPAEVLAELARDPDVRVRRNAARHSRLPQPEVALLLDDEDLGVIRAAAGSRALPELEMLRLVTEAGL